LERREDDKVGLVCKIIREYLHIVNWLTLSHLLILIGLRRRDFAGAGIAFSRLAFLIEDLAVFEVVAQDHLRCGHFNMQLLGGTSNGQPLVLHHFYQSQSFLA
jgi:hypothetical protein